MKNIVVIDGYANDAKEAIYLCGNKLASEGFVHRVFIDECIAREKEFPTGIINNIPFAIPHVKSDFIKKDSLCLLRLKQPVEFTRMDDFENKILTKLVFNFAIKNPDNHIVFLQKFISLAQNDVFLNNCLTFELKGVEKLLFSELCN